ncbi:MAG TPA: LysE family translocator [Opitutaceae bacterium]
MPFDLASILVILTVGLLTPGPDMLVVLKNSLGGRARGLATVAGIAVGLGLQTALLSAAFTLLAGHTATIANALRWGGAAVLVFIGIGALLARTPVADLPEGNAPRAASSSAFAEGLLCNLTNPKAFLFFTGVFSQLIGPESPRWLALALPAIITVHGALCWGILSSLIQSGQVAGRLRRAQAVLVRIFGALLVLFGLGLVLWRP